MSVNLPFIIAQPGASSSGAAPLGATTLGEVAGTSSEGAVFGSVLTSVAKPAAGSAVTGRANSVPSPSANLVPAGEGVVVSSLAVQTLASQGESGPCMALPLDGIVIEDDAGILTEPSEEGMLAVLVSADQPISALPGAPAQASNSKSRNLKESSTGVTGKASLVVPTGVETAQASTEESVVESTISTDSEVSVDTPVCPSGDKKKGTKAPALTASDSAEIASVAAANALFLVQPQRVASSPSATVEDGDSTGLDSVETQSLGAAAGGKGSGVASTMDFGRRGAAQNQGSVASLTANQNPLVTSVGPQLKQVSSTSKDDVAPGLTPESTLQLNNSSSQGAFSMSQSQTDNSVVAGITIRASAEDMTVVSSVVSDAVQDPAGTSTDPIAPGAYTPSITNSRQLNLSIASATPNGSTQSDALSITSESETTETLGNRIGAQEFATTGTQGDAALKEDNSTTGSVTSEFAEELSGSMGFDASSRISTVKENSASSSKKAQGRSSREVSKSGKNIAQTTEGEGKANNDNSGGTSSAQGTTSMYRDEQFTAPTARSSSLHEVAGIVDIRTSQSGSGTQTAETAKAQQEPASRTLNAVLEVAEKLQATNGKSVEFDLGFHDGTSVSVSLHFRNGAVHTTFRTDSPELRNVLATEWQSTMPASLQGNETVRIAEPQFASSSQSQDNSWDLNSQNSSQQQQSEQREAAEQSMVRTALRSSTTSVSKTESSETVPVQWSTSTDNLRKLQAFA